MHARVCVRSFVCVCVCVCSAGCMSVRVCVQAQGECYFQSKNVCKYQKWKLETHSYPSVPQGRGDTGPGSPVSIYSASASVAAAQLGDGSHKNNVRAEAGRGTKKTRHLLQPQHTLTTHTHNTHYPTEERRRSLLPPDSAVLTGLEARRNTVCVCVCMWAGVGGEVKRVIMNVATPMTIHNLIQFTPFKTVKYGLCNLTTPILPLTEQQLAEDLQNLISLTK